MEVLNGVNGVNGSYPLKPNTKDGVLKQDHFTEKDDDNSVVDLRLHVDLDTLLQRCYTFQDEQQKQQQSSGHGGSQRSPRIVNLSRVSTKDRGRIMRTDVFLPKGTLLLRIEPLSGAPDVNHQQTHCARCITKVDETSKVGCHGGCRQVVYCSTQCRDQDHQLVHHMECGFLAQWSTLDDQVAPRMVGSNDVVPDGNTRIMQYTRDGKNCSLTLDPYSWDYVRVLLHILTLHFTHPNHHAPQQSSPNSNIGHHANILQQAMDMIENRSLFPPDRLENEIANAASALDVYQDWILDHLPLSHHRQPKLSKDDLIGLICKEESNSFGLYDYPPASEASSFASSGPIIRRGYGLGFYADGQTHRFNHSCAPNLFRVFTGREMIFYAGRDIQPKEELNIAYMEVGGRTYRGEVPEQEQLEAFRRRKQYLKDIFFFDCGCARCQAEETWLAGNGTTKEVSSSMTGDGRTNESEENRYLRCGVTCSRTKERECFGHYAPPQVLRILGLGSKENSQDNHWQCVACGHRVQQEYA